MSTEIEIFRNSLKQTLIFSGNSLIIKGLDDSVVLDRLNDRALIDAINEVNRIRKCSCSSSSFLDLDQKQFYIITMLIRKNDESCLKIANIMKEAMIPYLKNPACSTGRKEAWNTLGLIRNVLQSNISRLSTNDSSGALARKQQFERRLKLVDSISAFFHTMEYSTNPNGKIPQESMATSQSSAMSTYRPSAVIPVETRAAQLEPVNGASPHISISQDVSFPSLDSTNNFQNKIETEIFKNSLGQTLVVSFVSDSECILAVKGLDREVCLTVKKDDLWLKTLYEKILSLKFSRDQQELDQKRFDIINLLIDDAGYNCMEIADIMKEAMIPCLKNSVNSPEYEKAKKTLIMLNKTGSFIGLTKDLDQRQFLKKRLKLVNSILEFLHIPSAISADTLMDLDLEDSMMDVDSEDSIGPNGTISQKSIADASFIYRDKIEIEIFKNSSGQTLFFSYASYEAFHFYYLGVKDLHQKVNLNESIKGHLKETVLEMILLLKYPSDRRALDKKRFDIIRWLIEDPEESQLKIADIMKEAMIPYLKNHVNSIVCEKIKKKLNIHRAYWQSRLSNANKILNGDTDLLTESFLVGPKKDIKASEEHFKAIDDILVFLNDPSLVRAETHAVSPQLSASASLVSASPSLHNSSLSLSEGLLTSSLNAPAGITDKIDIEIYKNSSGQTLVFSYFSDLLYIKGSNPEVSCGFPDSLREKILEMILPLNYLSDRRELDEKLFGIINWLIEDGHESYLKIADTMKEAMLPYLKNRKDSLERENVYKNLEKARKRWESGSHEDCLKFIDNILMSLNGLPAIFTEAQATNSAGIAEVYRKDIFTNSSGQTLFLSSGPKSKLFLCVNGLDREVAVLLNDEPLLSCVCDEILVQMLSPDQQKLVRTQFPLICNEILSLSLSHEQLKLVQTQFSLINVLIFEGCEPLDPHESNSVKQTLETTRKLSCLEIADIMKEAMIPHLKNQIDSRDCDSVKNILLEARKSLQLDFLKFSERLIKSDDKARFEKRMKLINNILEFLNSLSAIPNRTSKNESLTSSSR